MAQVENNRRKFPQTNIVVNCQKYNKVDNYIGFLNHTPMFDWYVAP